MLCLPQTSRSSHQSVLEDPRKHPFGTGTIPSRGIAAARGASMYPPRFDYLAPRSVEEALDVLAERGDDAKVLAGGQSLIPLLKLRFAAPEVLVDINRLPGLDTLSEENGWLRIGPLVRHRDAERSTLLRERYPTMAAAAPQISDPLVRNLGTVCGSLAHADPSGDWGAVMIATGAEDALRGAAPDDEAFRGAGELAAQAASPGSDLRGTVDYKRNVIRTFTERGLRNAAAIAANNQGGA